MSARDSKSKEKKKQPLTLSLILNDSKYLDYFIKGCMIYNIKDRSGYFRTRYNDTNERRNVQSFCKLFDKMNEPGFNKLITGRIDAEKNKLKVIFKRTCEIFNEANIEERDSYAFVPKIILPKNLQNDSEDDEVTEDESDNEEIISPNLKSGNLNDGRRVGSGNSSAFTEIGDNRRSNSTFIRPLISSHYSDTHNNIINSTSNDCFKIEVRKHEFIENYLDNYYTKQEVNSLLNMLSKSIMDTVKKVFVEYSQQAAAAAAEPVVEHFNGIQSMYSPTSDQYFDKN